MKKLIPGLLSMLLCLGMATGCDAIKDKVNLPDIKLPGFLENIIGGNDSASEEPDSSSEDAPVLHAHEKDLKDVKDYLQGIVNEMSLETRKNFTLINSYSFFGETAKYDIAWSASIDGVTVQEGETEDTIVIGELEEDTPYVLTATITDPEGCHTVKVEFEAVALKALSLVPTMITAKPVENTAYKLYVYQSTNAIDCYFIGEMDGFYFKTSETYTDGVDIYAEYVDENSFNLYFTKDGAKTYIGVQEGWNSKNSYWTFNVVMGETAPSTFVWSEDLKTIITTVPCRSDADNKNQDAAQSTTKTLYLGNYKSYNTFSSSTLDKAPTSNVGGLAVMVSKDSFTPEVKIATELERLSIGTTFIGADSETLPSTGVVYSDVAINWTVKSGDNVTIANNVLTTTSPAADTTAVITATLTCGGVTETKEFTISIKAETEGPAMILNQLYALKDGETLTGEFTLTGKITKLDSYNNPTIVVDGYEDMPVYCFKLKVENAVGDIITVKATTLKNHQGTYEFMDCTLVTEGGDEGGEEGGDEGEVSGNAFNIEAYATANGWANDTLYASVAGTDFTASISATPVGTYSQNSGKYYTSNQSWRIYQTESATLTFTAAEGKYIVSAKITYSIKNTGILTLNGTNIESNAVVTVGAKSVTFGVGQTGSATNGQVQITAIEVICADGEGGEAHEHSYGEGVVTNPTCTEEGYTTYTCECGDSYTADEVAALGHTFVDSKCVNCETAYVAPVASSWGLVTELKNGDLVLIGAPAYGKLLSAEKVNASSYYNKGVDYSIENFDNVTDAEIFTVTVNADGTYTFTSLTGDVIALADSYSSLNVTGNHKSWALTDRGDGTFLMKNTGRDTYLEWYASKDNWSTYTGGNTAEYYLSFYAKVESAGAHVHNHISEAHAATCDKAGYTSYTCACGDTYNVDGEAATGHRYEATVTAPTCTEKGYTTHTCSVCGDNYTDTEVDATGHTYVDGKCACGAKDPEYVAPHEHSYGEGVVTDPTCTEEGYTTYTCACGYSYTADKVAATGHSYGEGVVTDPTCTEEGYTTYTCACGYSYTADKVAATGHSYGEGVVTDPTCTEEGYTTYTCACGYSYTADEVAALGHTFVDSKCVSCEAAYVAPVASSWGLVTELKNGDLVLIGAPAYGKLLSAEKVSASSYYNKGVDYSIENFDNVTDAEIFTVTVNADGTYTFTSLTGDVIALADSYSSLNVTGNHKSWALTDRGDGTFLMKNTGRNTYLEWYASKNNWSTYTAGNTKEYYLSFYAKVESAEDHVHNHISEVHAATCDKAGYTSYTCACGDTYNVDGEAATGHSYGEGVVTAPTCTEKGYTTHTCSVCSNSYTDTEVDATGHTYVDGKCVTCGEEDPNTHQHSYTPVVTAPTCTAAGYTTYTCACGDTYTGDETAVVDHVDTNFDITCDFEGCTKRILPPANSKISLFTANHMTIVSVSNDYYVEGVITDIGNATSGTFTITDEAGDTLCIHLPKDADGNSYSAWKTLKVVVGDTIRVTGKPKTNTQTTSSKAKAMIQGGLLEVLKHEHNFSEPTCTEAAVCACLAVGDPALGHIDENADKLCDRCEWNLNLKLSNIVVATDPALANGVQTMGADGKAAAWTWEDDNFSVVIAKGTSTVTLYTTAKAYMQLKKLNTLTVTNKIGATIKSITISATNDTQLKNLVAALANNNVTFTQDAAAFSVTIEWNSTENLVIKNNGTSTAYVSGVEVVYEPKAAAHEHSYDEGVVTDPTCTEEGYTTYTCACGDSYVADKVDATGHSFAEGICGVCGAEDPDYVAPHEHSYDEGVVTDPTCTEEGYTTYTCACGDSYVANKVDATGHSYGEGVVTAPTCTEEGYTTYTCACGDSYVADKVDATGHSFAGGICGVCGEKDPNYAPTQEEIVEMAYALAKDTALEGTYTLTGKIIAIDTPYDSGYKNITVTIVVGDLTSKPIMCYRMKGDGAENLTKADVITVTGKIKNYGGTIEFDSGCTFVMLEKHECSTYTEATCKVPATCTVCDKAKDNILADHVYVNGQCECGATEGVVSNTVSVTIKQYHTDNGWKNATYYGTLTMDDVITVSAKKSNNNGKYYDSGYEWRMYQSDKGEVTVTAVEGYIIESVKITYSNKNGGTLVYDGTNYATNSVVTVNAETITFSLASTTGATNGQVKITAIEVTYKAV